MVKIAAELNQPHFSSLTLWMSVLICMVNMFLHDRIYLIVHCWTVWAVWRPQIPQTSGICLCSS